jgi:hypothetical protein
VDAEKGEEHFHETVKKYRRISWLCGGGTVVLGGYAVYSRNPVAETLASVCLVGAFIAPLMPRFRRGTASGGGLSVEVEMDPLEGDYSDAEPSEETDVTVVESPEDAPPTQ